MEERLARLGIWRLPLPTPFADVRVVNAYAIEDEGGGIALLDTGTDDERAHAALVAALAKIGFGLSDVRRIIVTHGHPDHYGAAQSLAERASPSLPVLGHPGDFDEREPTGSRWSDRIPNWIALFARHGVPDAVTARFEAVAIRSHDVVRPIRRLLPLAEGDALRFRHFQASVLHLPGHTAGLACLFDPSHGLLFSNDHLLQGVTPFLRVEPGPAGEEQFQPVPPYVASLERTRALDVRLVLPGHGHPFDDHRGEVDRALRKFARRQQRILAALVDGPGTAYRIMEKASPPPKPIFVKDVLSVTIAHLAALEARGEVRREEAGGVLRFAAAGGSR